MGSVGGGVGRSGLAGKKRKAAGGSGSGSGDARREPKRGLGVAELEVIRAQLETADSFYLVPSLSTPVVAPQPTPPPLDGHLPGVRYDRCVRNGAVQRDYYISYHGAEHYTNGVLPSFLASDGHAFPRQINQADQNVLTAIHPPKQPASSEKTVEPKNFRSLDRSNCDQEFIRKDANFVIPNNNQITLKFHRSPSYTGGDSEESYKLRLQDHRRRQQPQQHGQMRRAQVAFVDLVDSDDEGAAAAEEELDLELKL